jgi:hypothetical protein
MAKSRNGWRGFFLFLVGAALFGAFSNGGGGSSTTTSTSTGSSSSAGSPPRLSDADCAKDLSCWGERHILSATSACRPTVERLANFDAQWTDAWHEPKFSHYGWHDQEKGLIRYSGDRIKFQNGFGAFQPHVYRCVYDPYTKSVVSINASPGRMER